MAKLILELSDAEVAALYLSCMCRSGSKPDMAEASEQARVWVVAQLGQPCEYCGVPRAISSDGSYWDGEQWVSAYQLNQKLQRCENRGCPENGNVLVVRADGTTEVLPNQRDPQGGGYAEIPRLRRPVSDSPQA